MHALPRLLLLPTALAALWLGCAATAAPAANGKLGVRDQSYGSLGGSPTGSKPESKLWFNGGWWASMFNAGAREHRIYKLDPAKGAWGDTGVAIDRRRSSRADTLWDAAAGKLYVASHVFTTSGAAAKPGSAGRLFRYSYDASTGRYTLDTGFPVAINAARSETLVIDKDSTGTLWATWTQGSKVYVNHSVGGSDAAWGTPYVVPGAGTALTSDDISSLIHFGGHMIGVMWSNQADHNFHFAVHDDGAGDGSWSTSSVPIAGGADDHINLKTDSAGRVYAAVKTGATNASPDDAPMVVLLVRSAAGAWSATTFGTARDSQTRPIVQLDEEHGVVYLFATCPQPPKTSGQAGGDICEKTAPMSAPSFAPGIGTAVIRDVGSPRMNDATSTKQNLSAATGIVVMANNPATHAYWHMQAALVG